MHTRIMGNSKAQKASVKRRSVEHPPRQESRNRKKQNTNGKSPPYLTQILDISFSFLTPSLLAFRGINQHKSEIRTNQKDKQNRHTRWKQDSTKRVYCCKWMFCG